MTVVCLVTSKDSTRNYINRTAVYWPNTNSQYNKSFDFKLFDNGSNKNIQFFDEGDVVMLIGKFTYRKDYNGDNSLFVCF